MLVRDPTTRHTVSGMASRKGEFGEPVVLDVDGFDVRVSSPERVYFAARGETKLDLVNYYLSVGDGIVNALRERPCMLHRFPDGVSGPKVHQKRLPRGAPPWVETVRLHFPRYGLHADEGWSDVVTVTVDEPTETPAGDQQTQQQDGQQQDGQQQQQPEQQPSETSAP